MQYSVENYIKYVKNNFYPTQKFDDKDNFKYFRCGDSELLPVLFNSNELIKYKIKNNNSCCCLNSSDIENAIYYYTYLTLEIDASGGFDDLTRERYLDIFLSNRGFNHF